MGIHGRGGCSAAAFTGNATLIERKQEHMSLRLFNRNPLLDEVTRSRSEMDRIIGGFLGASMMPGMTPTESAFTRVEGWLPPVDVSESEDGVMIRAEVPGVLARDIEITVTGTTLNISGKKEDKEEIEETDFYRCERRFGAFRRVIELPESIDPDRVTAESENGVILIRIAKKPGLKSRRVEIKPTSRRIPVPG
jgi:HSP20 family protein